VDPVDGKLVTELVVALVAWVLIEELVDLVNGLVELTSTPTWFSSISLDKLVCDPASSSLWWQTKLFPAAFLTPSRAYSLMRKICYMHGMSNPPCSRSCERCLGLVTQQIIDPE